MSIDAGVQVVASSSQTYSANASTCPVSCLYPKDHKIDYICISPPVPAKSSSEKTVHTRRSLACFIRLRLNLRVKDLSYCFNCSLSSVSETFQRWINRMFTSMKCLIIWPSQEIIQSNMPQIFKELYSKTRCVIDCSEIFIECPCSYKARVQMHSNYKKHNTMKFLVGITRNVAISFLSKCCGEELLINLSLRTVFCSLLNMVLGNLAAAILAERGFTIADDLCLVVTSNSDSVCLVEDNDGRSPVSALLFTSNMHPRLTYCISGIAPAV